jgi:hypothetical protein
MGLINVVESLHGAANRRPVWGHPTVQRFHEQELCEEFSPELMNNARPTPSTIDVVFLEPEPPTGPTSCRPDRYA